jgi:predicted O-methyltransferase YrrM
MLKKIGVVLLAALVVCSISISLVTLNKVNKLITRQRGEADSKKQIKIESFVHDLSTSINKSDLDRFKPEQDAFVAESKQLSLSADWFTGNVPSWLMVFEKYKFYEKEIKALEIGSYEGLSSYFLLSKLPKAHLTCVDTWQGLDETCQGLSKYEKGKNIDQLEETFDSNLSKFKDRVSKFKGTSFSYFASVNGANQFDLVYIDGSHYCDDVLIDALKGFQLLKVGGVMIFDDYELNQYKHTQHNPKTAIDSFLKIKIGKYKIVFLGWQLIVEKTSSDVKEARD